MNGMADIYLITNKINNKQYVGQTTKSYQLRFKEHCYYAKTNIKSNPQLIDAKIKQYGIENFTVQLLESVPINLKDEREQYYIKLYNTYKKGYNRTIGGDFNPMFDNSIRQKHSRIVKSLEHRKKISEGVRKAITPELREWFKHSTTNRWNSWTQDQRNSCIRGFNKYNNSKKQKVAIIDEEGKIIHKFNSASEACMFCNKPIKEASNLLSACDKINKNNKRAKYYGYYWIKL